MPMQPVDRFYPVRFANPQALREWSLQTMETVASRDDVSTVPDSSRAVVFVPIQAPPQGATYGYVSEGALAFVFRSTRDVLLDRTTVSIHDLPDGLGLLIGNSSDATTYEERLRGPGQ
jgi:hypothetical protein